MFAYADYVGETYAIKFDTAGFNHNRNMDLMPTSAIIDRSRNVNTNYGSIDVRGGTSHVNTNPIASVSQVVGTDSNDYTCILDHTSAADNKPITGENYEVNWQLSGTTGEGAVWTNSTSYNTTQITGIYDYRLLDGSQFTIVSTSDGEVYKNNTTTIRTGASTGTFFDFATYDNEAYMVDGNTVPHTWDGSAGSTTAITSVPTDWTGTNYPQWIIPHGFQNSERMVAGGCATTPHTIYLSLNGNGDDFLTSPIAIRIETQDGTGIIGAETFGDRLVLFAKNRAFLLNDTDPDSTKWEYVAAQWIGGAANFRLIIRTPNDIICMTDSGDIYSVSTAQEYGDYKRASLTRPAFIDRWIRDKIRLDEIDKFHAIYDPELRAIKFFVVRNGRSVVDTALVYFIDRPPKEAWVIHTNENFNSGYSASTAAVVEVSGLETVYTGDYSGDIWTLETTSRNDNGNGYYAGFKTPWLNMEQPRIKKHFKKGWMLSESEGSHIVSINWWVDGVAQTQTSISMEGTAGVLGGSETKDLLGTFILGGGGSVKDRYFDLNESGRRIQFEFFNTGTGKKFSFQQLLVDWLGKGKPND
jgi:hypothetical protein